MRDNSKEEGILKQKFDNMQELSNTAELIFLQGLILQFSEMKPDNKDLQKMVSAITRVSIYFSKMQLDANTWKHLHSDLRHANSKLVLENRDLKERVTEVESELKFSKL
jgi:hypothetical protein